MNFSKSLLSLAVAVVSVSGLGCAPAASGAYEGEPLFTVKGSLTGNTPTQPLANPLVGVVWVKFSPDGDSKSTQTTSISGATFPATFDLNLFDPPGAAALNDLSTAQANGALAFGRVLAADDTDGNGALAIDGTDVPFGYSLQQVIVYVAREPQGTMREMFVNPAAATVGFHLARGVCRSAGETFDRLELVDNEPITVTTFDPWGPTALDQSASCLNFY
jgi:hypothetical protein